MEEGRIEAVILAFDGSVVNLRDGVETLLYELARRHGESPLDRGRTLRRRLDALQRFGSFAWAYETLAAERGYRWASSGEQAFQRAVANCRPFADAAPALTSARAAGLKVVVVGSSDARLVDAALRPLDGAFDAVLHACPLDRVARAVGLPAARTLHVATATAALRTARSLGMHTAWLNRSASPAPDGAVFDVEWRTLGALGAWIAGRRPVAATS